MALTKVLWLQDSARKTAHPNANGPQITYTSNSKWIRLNVTTETIKFLKENFYEVIIVIYNIKSIRNKNKNIQMVLLLE